MATRTDPGLLLRPMLHVDDLAASIAFYRLLGGEVIHGGDDSDWVLMQLGTIQIGLIPRPPDRDRGEDTIELTFDASMPLPELESHLHRAGFPIAGVGHDRDFGDQLHVRTPEGLVLKISRREPG
ncbi:VOC family protein [Paractinoplanes lichenicola]|uniref:VOC family protein n=1 Tax=Paractinoplanes lichenicola TaxID=2802976 RepID=A0ABS1VKC1_9ACTN|nr:VOC family protein [Actinoplanes lichenicola]MBL7255108.1 VOC family protein [Actinoplanes lichenicola]